MNNATPRLIIRNLRNITEHYFKFFLYGSPLRRNMLRSFKPLYKSLNLNLVSRSFVSSSFIQSNNIEILYTENGICTMSLCREEGKNSFSRQMLDEFVENTDMLSRNVDIRALILQSKVPKVFCAGADLKERVTMKTEEEVENFVSKLRMSFYKFRMLPFPTIAAIEGVALGGGLELALNCDLRVASENALIGLPETALAIIPGAGGTQSLQRVVGQARAKELILLAKRMKGKEAYEKGVITEVTPNGQAYQKALVLAEEMSKKGPIALRMAKKSIDEGGDLDYVEALEVEQTCYGGVLRTEDRVEGLIAFKEKRDPTYKGK